MCFTISKLKRYTCGHVTRDSQHNVDCNRLTCKYSQRHRTVTHNCQRDCDQQMGPEQAIVEENTARQCPQCSGETNGN